MSHRPLSILMVDASLFTAPYDEGITKGLEANGAVVKWACRDMRPNEDYQLLSELQVKGIFYPGIVASVKNAGVLAKIKKGLSHGASLIRLWRFVLRTRPDIIHFQWIVFPLLDILFIALIRRIVPVIMTVHDTLPFNGNPTSRLQGIGLSHVMRSTNRLIVHTHRAAFVIGNIVGKTPQVDVVAHGPLGQVGVDTLSRKVGETRWTILMFGKIQAYKGVDILVESITLLSPDVRRMIRVVVAGEAFVDTAPLTDAVCNAGIGDIIEFRFWRHTDNEVANLLAEADTFVFPYRQIDASGVLYLVAQYQKWIVASDIGIFRELIQEGANGSLVTPEEAGDLASALTMSINRAPTIQLLIEPWDSIGKQTLDIYKSVIGGKLK